MVTHKGTQTLQTPRLVLRKAVREDAPSMFENWAKDPEVSKFLTWPPHNSVKVTQMVIDSWIAEYDKEDTYQWMIVPKDTPHSSIGTISVVHQKANVKKAEIGYCIGRRWWHQGIMTEALQAVIGFLFDEVGMNRIEACHDPRNPNSGLVMKKCGMVYEGTLRQADRNNQGICDLCVWAVLKQDRKS